MLKYFACSESFADSFDRVVLCLCAEGDQIEVNSIYKATGHNLCFKRSLGLVHCLLMCFEDNHISLRHFFN